jgi:hypothetical protein
MPDILIRLHPFADLEHATTVADDIREAGKIRYINAENADVEVNVGDVTVEA